MRIYYLYQLFEFNAFTSRISKYGAAVGAIVETVVGTAVEAAAGDFSTEMTVDSIYLCL